MSFALGRYSDRVRSEAERLDQLELDDLEVIHLLSLMYFHFSHSEFQSVYELIPLCYFSVG